MKHIISQVENYQFIHFVYRLSICYIRKIGIINTSILIYFLDMDEKKCWQKDSKFQLPPKHPVCLYMTMPAHLKPIYCLLHSIIKFSTYPPRKRRIYLNGNRLSSNGCVSIVNKTYSASSDAQASDYLSVYLLLWRIMKAMNKVEKNSSRNIL